MRDPFLQPPGLWQSPSLNRVQLNRLEGLPLPAALTGKTAFALLSAAALRELARATAGKSTLPPGQDELSWLEQAWQKESTREQARAVSVQLGERLGYLLLALAEGHRENRTEWDERRWHTWQQVRHAWLGGGLVAGRTGTVVAARAGELLRAAGYDNYRVQVATHPTSLPLLGAARHAPPSLSYLLLFDFGNSRVKRAVATFGGDVVTGLTHLSSLPAPCREAAPATRCLELMSEQIYKTWRDLLRAGWRLDPHLVVAMAAYLYRGHPYPGQGGRYDRLQTLGPHLPTTVQAALRQRGLHVTVQLLHDGSAATAAFAGAEASVVLMLGTALGWGFPPSAAGLRPLAPALAAVEEEMNARVF